MTRTLYIIRGLPSAGKSTLAKDLSPNWNTSLDDFRVNTTAAPTYDPNTYPLLVARVQQLVTQWMKEGRTPIAAANVNWSRSDVNDWLLLAASYGYRAAVVHVETDLTDEQLAARSETKAPIDAIRRFRERWQPWGA
jgi:predicted kinase